MSNSAIAITNLLYRYAELLDGGELEAVAELFQHAQVKAGDDLLDSAGMLQLWRRILKIHPCGTPRTRHIITNPILEVDEIANTASCRAYYTVVQATDTLPLQVIAAGRYHDEFERAEGIWRFRYRDYTLLDFKGDLSEHLNFPVP